MLSAFLASLWATSIVLAASGFELSGNDTTPVKTGPAGLTRYFPAGTLIDRRSSYTNDPECDLRPSLVWGYRIDSCIIRNSDSWRFTDVSETDGSVTFTWTQCTDTNCSSGCESVVHTYPNCDPATGQVWDASSELEVWTDYTEWFKYHYEEFSTSSTCSGEWGYWHATDVCTYPPLGYCNPDTYVGQSVGTECFES